MKSDTSPLDWKQFFPNTIPIYYTNSKKGPNLLCLHGAGHSGLSFSYLASLSKHFRLITFDFRGHGNNTGLPSTDLSLSTSISDTEKVLFHINTLFPSDTILLLGHSFGGVIAIKSLCHVLSSVPSQDIYDKIQGLIVIDVVEGSAIESLPFMRSVVESRQKTFATVNEAIEYMLKTQIRNVNSARVSIPPLLTKADGGYQWKTDLVKTEEYWKEWYENLSKCFLSIKVPKMLILTDTCNLDTPLTIAHMEGKFKLSVIKGTGHHVHEDDPGKVYEHLVEFMNAFRLPGRVDEIKMVKSKLGNQTKVVKYVEFKG